MINKKAVRIFATSTITSSNTVPWGSSNLANSGELWSSFSFMEVIVNVATLTGTAPGLWVTVQEQFPTGDGTSTYITVAKTLQSLTAKGPYILSSANTNLQSGTPYAAPGTQQNILLGKGGAKQVVFSTEGTVTALSADAIFVFWSD